MQRDRAFDSYQDLEARYEHAAQRVGRAARQLGRGPRRAGADSRRPTRPTTTSSRSGCPTTLPAPQQPLDVEYRIRWQKDNDTRPPLAWVAQTRRGRGYSQKARRQHRFVVDFDGPALAKLPPDAKVEPRRHGRRQRRDRREPRVPQRRHRRLSHDASVQAHRRQASRSSCARSCAAGDTTLTRDMELHRCRRSDGHAGSNARALSRRARLAAMRATPAVRVGATRRARAFARCMRRSPTSDDPTRARIGAARSRSPRVRECRRAAGEGKRLRRAAARATSMAPRMAPAGDAPHASRSTVDSPRRAASRRWLLRRAASSAHVARAPTLMSRGPAVSRPRSRSRSRSWSCSRILFGWISAGFWTALAGFVRAGRAAAIASRSRAPPRDDAPIAPATRAPRSSCRSATRTWRACSPACARPTSRSRAPATLDAVRLLRAVRHRRSRHARRRGRRVGSSCAARVDGFGRIFYRWRTHRIKRKSGNVADFCRRWGTQLPLHGRARRRQRDERRRASSTLVRLMEAQSRRRHHPDRAARRRPRHAATRASQQFATRVYGPLFTAGPALLAARRIALLGPQRDHPHRAVHASTARSRRLPGHAARCRARSCRTTSSRRR